MLTSTEMRHARSRAFTVIELLTVIAIIGILAALIFPGVAAAQRTAAKTQTRVRFNQWAAAIESYRTEYGCYPAFHSSHLVNPPGQNTAADSLHLFHDILAARRRDGSALPVFNSSTGAQDPETQNRKLIRFYSFAEPEFTDAATPAPNLVRDAAGNTEIAVIVDANLDGVIDATDCGGTFPAVNGIAPDASDIPATGLRAGVIFYAPAPGATASNPEFIFSWK